MIRTIFFDVGGVLLTNGWDREQRLSTATEFGLDYEEFQDRHDFVAHDFETGHIDLQEYLSRTVFYRDREFSRAAFTASIFAHSQELPGSLDLLDELAALPLQLATLNNESREINEHRITGFGLNQRISLFLSSCYLGVKKPEQAIYELALHVTQRRPEECIFIDDRELNLECAADLGIDGLLFEDLQSLRNSLAARGVAIDGS